VSKIKSLVNAAVLITVLAIAAGCAAKAPVDVSLKGTIVASDELNLSSDGRPSPLRISIFQLRKVDKFKDADFFALYDNAQASLGTDLLAREDVTLKPGDVRRYEGEIDPETRYIGVIAAFRDINQAQWSSFVEMPGKNVLKLMKRDPIKITAGSLAVDISTGN
jgi:type VI secretion system protein VasD